MQLLPIIVAMLLGTVALAFVLFPLYRRTSLKTPQAASLPTAVSSQVEAEREQTARAALQEVELDYQLGNLAETDYRSLRTRYMRRAVLAMKSRREREQEVDELIEEQLRRMKEKNGHATE
jgi:flagellar basal body-associated protein FliL